MFERFTREARDVVVLAHEVAREVGARSVDARHVLLCLVESRGPARNGLESVGIAVAAFAERLRNEVAQGGLDAGALASVGIDLDAVRARADAVFGEGALDQAGGRRRSGHLPFSPDAKKVLELALREAIRLHVNRIDSAMLLLGVLRSTGSPAESVLRSALAECGSSVADLRTALEKPAAEAS